MSYVWSKRFQKPVTFKGRYFNKDPSVNWKPFIPIENQQIQYLEIGCADGGNVIHIAKSYAKHPNSFIYCVDPWFDYDDYDEYKGQQDLAWNNFNYNVKLYESKLKIYRGLSDDIVPTFQDNFFDIIYVDGNHETEYVYRDGIMAYNKCKSGGYIIFDDYSSQPYIWPQTKKGIDMFLDEYKDKIQILSIDNNFLQVIIRKI